MRLPQPAPGRRIAYGLGAHQFGELRLPPGSGPFPVAIVIHGGCWQAEYGLGYMGNFCGALTEAGMATWAVEYRRVGDPGGGWPGTFHDVARAADCVLNLARDHALDQKRVIGVGHSAGGHLALWLAARQKLPRASELFTDIPIQLRAVVSLAGIPDLACAGRENICGDMAYQLMGGTAEEFPMRYREASPAEMLPLGVKQVLIHGEADQHVPATLSENFSDQARRHGDSAEFIRIPNAGHFELTDPSCDSGREVVNSVVRAAA